MNDAKTRVSTMCMNCMHPVLSSGHLQQPCYGARTNYAVVCCKTVETTTCLLHWPPTHLMSNFVGVETERFIAD